jgi:hypothetical protein
VEGILNPRLLLAIKVLLLMAIFGWLAHSFPPKDWETLRQQPKDWFLLAFALALVLTANLISFLRWRMLVRSLDVPFHVTEAIRLGFLGCLFNLVSAGSVGGDVFKAVAAAKSKPSRRPEIVASVLVDRIFGLFALVLLAAVVLLLFTDNSYAERFRWIRRAAGIMAAAGVTVLSSMVVAGERLPVRWLHRLPWVGHGLYRMARSCLLFHGRPGLALAMVLSSVLVHGLITFSMYSISNAMYQKPPGLQEHFVVIPPAIVAGAVPITPGGMGVQEAVISELFRDLPSKHVGFSGLIVAAMYRLITFAVAGIGAAYYFFGRRIN